MSILPFPSLLDVESCYRDSFPGRHFVFLWYSVAQRLTFFAALQAAVLVSYFERFNLSWVWCRPVRTLSVLEVLTRHPVRF